MIPSYNFKSMVNIYQSIDHVAIAVLNLEKAILFYQSVLGFELVDRKTTLGKNSGMVSAVMSGGEFTIVLLQGLEAESQVCRYINKYGPGVQHVAFLTSDLDHSVELLKGNGIHFSTSIIQGTGLRQIFSNRDENSGMMFEIIERKGNEGFEDDSVQDLFVQLEKSELV